MLSDESSSDSDSGIRFKTDSTRRQQANPDLLVDKNKRGGFDGPNRGRAFGGNRDRDRRSPPKPRERSPFRDKGRFNNDRYARDERNRIERPRQRISPVRDRNRDSDRVNRDDRYGRNDSFQKREDFREIMDRSRRDAVRFHETRSPARINKDDPRELDRRRGYEQTNPHERRQRSRSNNKDTKDRLNRQNDDNDKRSNKAQTEKRPDERAEKSIRDLPQRIREVSEPKIKNYRDETKTRDRDSSSMNRSRISPIRFDGNNPNKDKKLLSKNANKEKKNVEKISPKRVCQSADRPESSKKVDRKSENSLPDADLSDTEPKPVSYYNMISEKVPIISHDLNHSKKEKLDEPIHVSDSSEDEDTLRLKLLLLEDELKKTKKKTKHKEKKAKKQRKKSKTKGDSASSGEKSDSKLGPLLDESMSMKVTISGQNSVDSEKRIVSHEKSLDLDASKNNVIKINPEESNEEGEILSDSDDQKTNIDPTDLRHRLARQMGPSLPSMSPNKSKVIDLREKLSTRSGDVKDVAGPALPPHMRNDDEFDDGTSPVVEGPALPPHLKKNYGEKHLGPSLSAEMRERLAADQDISEDDDTVGPLPDRSDKEMSETQKMLEERALKIKMAALDGKSVDEPKAREEWMLELPDAKAKHLGFGPRQFRKKEAPDLTDRSSWTDTPEQKALKASGVQVEDEEKVKGDLKREAEIEYLKQRDMEQAEAAKKHKKKHKRDKSLLELHQKKAEKKKKKEKESDEPTRRPFSREVDLKVNRFDEAQKKAIVKKAQLLDTRFSTGEAKFL